MAAVYRKLRFLARDDGMSWESREYVGTDLLFNRDCWFRPDSTSWAGNHLIAIIDGSTLQQVRRGGRYIG